ncbi:MAG TPA: retropepsin-like aspartic protease [Steroidobacteraceae bacterium]|nr:retropepsin-like aspartic protease [Steroidobacteraceae bacterium]
MSAYYLNLVAVNPKQEDIRSEPVRVLVDTGSELSWMPSEVLARAGIHPRRKRLFTLADGRKMEREVGFCILESEGFITNDEVVFAQSGDLHLLGVRTLEGFGVMVDALAHKLVATATLAAGAPPQAAAAGAL